MASTSRVEGKRQKGGADRSGWRKRGAEGGVLERGRKGLRVGSRSRRGRELSVLERSCQRSVSPTDAMKRKRLCRRRCQDSGRLLESIRSTSRTKMSGHHDRGLESCKKLRGPHGEGPSFYLPSEVSFAAGGGGAQVRGDSKGVRIADGVGEGAGT